MSLLSVSTKLTRSEKIKWLIVIAIGAICWLIPTNDVYTSDVRKFTVITLVAILIVAFELMNIIIPAIFMCFAYVLCGVAPTEIAFQGFTASSTFLVLGCLVLVAGLQQSGLLVRLSYYVMAKVGGSFKGVMIGLFVACAITSYLTMGNSFALMAAFGVGVIAALKLQDTKSAAAIGVLIGLCTVGIRSMCYSPMCIAVQVAQSQVVLGDDYQLTYLGVLLHNWPLFVPLLIMIAVLIKYGTPKEPITGKEYFLVQYQKLGKMTMREKKAAGIIGIIVAWMVFANYIPLSSDYALILVPWLLFFPGINVATAEAIKQVDFSIVFFVPACFGIGNVATHLGLGETLANMLLPVLTSLSNHGFLVVVYLIVLLLNFIMTPYAIHACVTIPLLNMGMQMGVDPLAINYMLMHGADAIIMPYEYTPYLVIFAFGMVKMKDFIKLMSIRLVITAIFLCTVVVWYWNLFGLY